MVLRNAVSRIAIGASLGFVIGIVLFESRTIGSQYLSLRGGVVSTVASEGTDPFSVCCTSMGCPSGMCMPTGVTTPACSCASSAITYFCCDYTTGTCSGPATSCSSTAGYGGATLPDCESHCGTSASGTSSSCAELTCIGAFGTICCPALSYCNVDSSGNAICGPESSPSSSGCAELTCIGVSGEVCCPASGWCDTDTDGNAICGSSSSSESSASLCCDPSTYTCVPMPE